VDNFFAPRFSNKHSNKKLLRHAEVNAINVRGMPYNDSMNEKQLKALMAQIVRANSAKLEAEKKK
jgi:hypothetical protein